jgi:hypothetical protein
MAFEDMIKGSTGLGTKVVTEEDVAFDECPNPNCHLHTKWESEGSCTFETCLYSQLPIHDKGLVSNCIICDTEFKANVENIRIPICEDCLKALRHVLIGHRNYCTECKEKPIEKESEFNQYLSEGDDPSNESRDSEYYSALSD